MSQRRLFSPEIVASDAFLDMPISGQALYFHLGMHADDDGFVNPRKIMRMIGASEDDLNILLAKRFLLAFKSGVVVIKHWLIHNSIRKDRYHETRYLEEKELIYTKQNKAYSELATRCQPIGNHSVPEVKLSKVNNVAEATSLEVKKEMKTYNENDHTLNDLPAVNLDTGEIELQEKSKTQPKDKKALGIQKYFNNKAEENTNTRPLPSKIGYINVLRIMKSGLSDENIKQMIDDWFSAGYPPEKAIQITQCFSNFAVNSWKAKNGIK